MGTARPGSGSQSWSRMTDGRAAGPGTERATSVPFNRPYATGAEFDYIREAIRNAHVSGNGPFTRRCIK
jgi:hypothetical protein